MTSNRTCALAGALLLAASTTLAAGEAKTTRAFEWSTKSAEARQLLAELQTRIENFQFGATNVELAKKIVTADPQFAMGVYYLSAVTPAPENQKHLDEAAKLAPKASDGERRFIEAMVVARADNGANFNDAIPQMEKLAADYPGERLVHLILGQMYQNADQPEPAKATFEKAQAIAPSNRVRSFLANYDLLEGEYAQARAKFAAIEKDLPEGSAPFAVRYGISFTHLYEGNVDAALESLRTFLAEYRESDLNRNFPEVFIWNSIARINLENGRLKEAMQAYEKGYESVPGSSLSEDQKKVWLGRLHHGKCRVLAKLGQHEAAWKEAETVRTMIESGGADAKQYLPAYHYLVGYLKLEAGDAKAAVEHLGQADPTDPFQRLLLARAHERLGDKAAAKKVYTEVVETGNTGMERALSYPEAKRKLSSL